MPTASLPRACARIATLTALLLLVPLLAMQFTHEVAWDGADFAAAGLLLFGAGMSYVLAARFARSTVQRVVIGFVVLTTLATIWAELAVGLFR